MGGLCDVGGVKCSLYITSVEKHLCLIAQVLFGDVGEKRGTFNEVSFGYIARLFSTFKNKLFFEIWIKRSSCTVLFTPVASST